MPWTSEAKSRAVRSVFGAKGLKVGLRTAEGEETDDAYERQPVDFVESGGEARNAGEVRFSPYARDSASPVTGWFVVDAHGVQLASEPIDDPNAPREGYVAFFAAGDLVVSLK